MYVRGLSSTIFSPSSKTSTRSERKRLRRSLAARRRASSSTTMKPRLCRVAAYSRPGFPRPTMIFTSKTPLKPSPRRPGAILPPRFCHGVSFLLLWAGVSPSEGTPPMFGIGYQEMFIVLVVAMVIFGPKRLPELAGQVGRWVRDFRRMSSDLTGEFEKTFAEVDEVKKTLHTRAARHPGRGRRGRQERPRRLEEVWRQGHCRREEGDVAPAKKGTAAAATGSNPARSTSLSKTAAHVEGSWRQWRAGEDRARRQARWNRPRDASGRDKSGSSRRCLVLRPRRRVSAAKNGSSAAANGAAGDDAISPRAPPPSRIRLCPAEHRLTAAWSSCPYL